jgi:hypothetical protein
LTRAARPNTSAPFANRACSMAGVKERVSSIEFATREYSSCSRSPGRSSPRTLQTRSQSFKLCTTSRQRIATPLAHLFATFPDRRSTLPPRGFYGSREDGRPSSRDPSDRRRSRQPRHRVLSATRLAGPDFFEKPTSTTPSLQGGSHGFAQHVAMRRQTSPGARACPPVPECVPVSYPRGHNGTPTQSTLHADLQGFYVEAL